TRVETFTDHMNDGTSTADQVVSVSITGNNEDAKITVGAGDSASGAVTEDVATDGSNNLNASGTLSFSDVDLIDRHSVTGVTPSVRALGTLTATVTHDSTTTGTGGVISWHYTVGD